MKNECKHRDENGFCAVGRVWNSKQKCTKTFSFNDYFTSSDRMDVYDLENMCVKRSDYGDVYGIITDSDIEKLREGKLLHIDNCGYGFFLKFWEDEERVEEATSVPTSSPESVDYRELFKKYLNYIFKNEGATYLYGLYEHLNGAAVHFSREELDILRKLDEETQAGFE